jgi:hypothetical protein
MLQQVVIIVTTVLMLELAHIRLGIAPRLINMMATAVYTGNCNLAPSGRKETRGTEPTPRTTVTVAQLAKKLY